MKETEKLQLQTSFQINVRSLPQGVWKQFDTLGKYTYRELTSTLGLLQKNSLFAKSIHKQHLFQEHDFSFNVYTSVANTNLKEQGPLMDQDRGKP